MYDVALGEGDDNGFIGRLGPLNKNGLIKAFVDLADLIEDTGQFQVIREQAGTFADSIKLWSGV